MSLNIDQHTIKGFGSSKSGAICIAPRIDFESSRTSVRTSYSTIWSNGQSASAVGLNVSQSLGSGCTTHASVNTSGRWGIGIT